MGSRLPKLAIALSGLILPGLGHLLLGKTARGVVCDADVDGFNSSGEKVAAEEIFYRLEPSDNNKILWVEYITRDQAMGAR